MVCLCFLVAGQSNRRATLHQEEDEGPKVRSLEEMAGGSSESLLDSYQPHVLRKMSDF